MLRFNQHVSFQRNNVDIMVVYIHWGKEYQLSPEKNQRKMGQFLKSLGFHLIIGAHPHVIQGHGYYGKSFLSYSLGNFLFGQFKTSYPVRAIICILITR